MTPIIERLRTWIRRLYRLSTLKTVERAMDDEMRHHVECEIAERVGAGESHEAARRAALRDFGGVERFKEDARDARGLRPIEDLVADTRHAVRVLRKNPGHTAAVVVTFALGIAAAGAIFAVVYGVLLRPLPYADPDRLVAVWERNIPRNQDRNVVSVATFEAWRRASTSFAGMAGLVPRPVTLSQGDLPERVMGAEVSPGYFQLLGVLPMLGRDFEAADEQATGAAVAILVTTSGSADSMAIQGSSVGHCRPRIARSPLSASCLKDSSRRGSPGSSRRTSGSRSRRRQKTAAGVASCWSSRGSVRTSPSSAPVRR